MSWFYANYSFGNSQRREFFWELSRFDKSCADCPPGFWLFGWAGLGRMWDWQRGEGRLGRRGGRFTLRRRRLSLAPVGHRERGTAERRSTRRRSDRNTECIAKKKVLNIGAMPPLPAAPPLPPARCSPRPPPCVAARSPAGAAMQQEGVGGARVSGIAMTCINSTDVFAPGQASPPLRRATAASQVPPPPSSTTDPSSRARRPRREESDTSPNHTRGRPQLQRQMSAVRLSFCLSAAVREESTMVACGGKRPES
jgi:hypothetical protein